MTNPMILLPQIMTQSVEIITMPTISSSLEWFGLGGLLGLLYFGGLWFTLKRLPKTPRPILFVVTSYCLRLWLLLGVFHLILQRSPPEFVLGLLLVCFFGFLSTRTLLIWNLQPRDR